MSRQTISFEDSSSSRVADFPSRFSSAKDLATTSSAPGAPAEEEEEEDKERKEKEERGFLGRRERLRNMRPEKPNFPVFLLFLLLNLSTFCETLSKQMCLLEKKRSSLLLIIGALCRVGKTTTTTTTTMHTAAAFAAALPMRPLINAASRKGGVDATRMTTTTTRRSDASSSAFFSATTTSSFFPNDGGARRGRALSATFSRSSSSSSSTTTTTTAILATRSGADRRRSAIVTRASSKKDEEKKKKKKKKKNKKEKKEKKKKSGTTTSREEELLHAVQQLKQEMQTMKLEMRAKETEREPLMAPSAEEVMNGGSRSRSSGAASDEATTPMQTQEEKDDYFNKIANDLLTPALGETIDNPDTIIVDAANWSGDGTNRGHEWPLLRNGDNDVYLMTLVHSALMENGFWCGEDDTEEMYFGKKTEEAVEYFQGSKGMGLEVNGMIDTETWLALLGKEKFEWGPAPGAILDEDVASCREGIARKAFEEAQKKLEAVSSKEEEDPYGEDIEAGPRAEDDFIDVKGSSGVSVEWPILRLDEGGLAVHKMQAMLSSLGFNCGEDDAEYWFMGTDTKNALQAFQASEMLPETGIVDFTTWKKLFEACGHENATVKTIEEAFAMVAENEYSIDRSPGCEGEKGVWLIGEQRYENCKT